MIENGAKGSDVPYKYTYCNELDWFDVNGRRARALSRSFRRENENGKWEKIGCAAAIHALTLGRKCSTSMRQTRHIMALYAP